MKRDQLLISLSSIYSEASKKSEDRMILVIINYILSHVFWLFNVRLGLSSLFKFIVVVQPVIQQRHCLLQQQRHKCRLTFYMYLCVHDGDCVFSSSQSVCINKHILTIMFSLTYISICMEAILSHIYKYIYIHNHIIGVDSFSLCLCSSRPARQRLTPSGFILV